jgi:deoxyribonuclease V
VEIPELHDWPTTESAAVEIQLRLRSLVDLEDSCPEVVETVTGLDVAYDKTSNHIAATAVTIDSRNFATLEERTIISEVSFPYAPGLFAFRELPPLLDALRSMTRVPDLLVCDGQGLAHPRRFGLACHIGVLTGLPSIGVGKTGFAGKYQEPEPTRGAVSPLTENGDTVGSVLRTQTGVNPVFVSVGHRIGLEHACRQVLALCPSFRLPESTRQADHAARKALRRYLSASAGT